MSPLLAAFLLAQTPPPPPVEVPFRTVAFGANGQIKDGGAIVIRDAAAFDDYRKRMKMADAKKPTIDWRKEQAIAIHAAGIGYGMASLQISKVWKKADGALEIEAYLDKGNVPAVPTPGVMQVLRKEGLYAMIVVPPAKGEVTLKVVDPPRDRTGKSGTLGPR